MVWALWSHTRPIRHLSQSASEGPRLVDVIYRMCLTCGFHHPLQVITSERRRVFRAGDMDERDMWVSAILDVLKEVAHVDSSGMAEGTEAPPTLMYVLIPAWEECGHFRPQRCALLYIALSLSRGRVA